MSEAVRRLVSLATIATALYEDAGMDTSADLLRGAIAAVELELDPPFTIHKVVKTVAADDRPQQDEQTLGFR
jgi:hypothetical protein